MKIGFIGIGVMGGAIVNHLLAHDYTVIGHTRTKTKALPQIEAGMIWADSIAEVMQETALIFTMVGFPEDVRAVYLDEGGILAHTTAGQIIVDLTTSTPTLAQELATKGAAQGVHILDAPVTGGDVGAQSGTLSMMIGGDATIFQQIEPILALFTSTRSYFGPAGKGQHMKMANQIAIAANIMGMAESLAYARASGLDLDLVIATLSGGSAASWQITNNGPKILAHDNEPGFYIKHFIKDMRIALTQMHHYNIQLPNLTLAESLFTELLEAGYGDLGTQAIYKLYEY